MKNYTLIMFFALLFMFVSSGYSQSKYGNVTMEEMTMEVYPQDTAATAVVLSKIGTARFIFSLHKLFQIEYTIQTRIKILKLKVWIGVIMRSNIMSQQDRQGRYTWTFGHYI